MYVLHTPVIFFPLGIGEGELAKRYLTVLKFRPPYTEDNIPDQLRGVFGNCACHERVKQNPDTMERCPQPYISWENSTHYIDNNICEWQKNSSLIDILGRCEQIKKTGTFGGFVYGTSWQNDTHYIDNTVCEWEKIK